MIPRSRKFGYGLLLGCRSELDGGHLILIVKKVFLTLFEKELTKNRELFTACLGQPSQSIGRGRISREGALDVRESRERRDKIVPIFSPEKQEKRNFGLVFFYLFLSRIA